MKSLLVKLGKVQTELKAPKNQRNNFGKYNYRNLEDIMEAVKPLLAKHGLTQIVSDTIEMIGDRIYVKATVTVYDIDSGKKIVAEAYARETETKKGMDHSQLTGATSSYARKYAMNGMYSIDDTKDADSMDNTIPTPLKEKSGKEKAIDMILKRGSKYTREQLNQFKMEALKEIWNKGE